MFISDDFLAIVNDFLSMLIVWIAPFGGVWLMDGLLRRWTYDPVDIHAVAAGPAGRYWGWHGINPRGFAAMLSGSAVCLLTVNSPIFQGPLSKALDGADLSWILGPPVAAAVYFLIARAQRPCERGGSRKPHRRGRERWERRPRSTRACSAREQPPSLRHCRGMTAGRASSRARAPGSGGRPR